MESLDFQHFKDWMFLGLIASTATLILRYLGKIAKSLMELNIKVAELLQQTSWHSKILDQHEQRISHLESRPR